MKAFQIILTICLVLAEIENPNKKVRGIMKFIKSILLFFKIFMLSLTGYVGYMIITLIIQSIKKDLTFGMIYGILCLFVYIGVVIYFIKSEPNLRMDDNR